MRRGKLAEEGDQGRQSLEIESVFLQDNRHRSTARRTIWGLSVHFLFSFAFHHHYLLYRKHFVQYKLRVSICLPQGLPFLGILKTESQERLVYKLVYEDVKYQELRPVIFNCILYRAEEIVGRKKRERQHSKIAW